MSHIVGHNVAPLGYYAALLARELVVCPTSEVSLIRVCAPTSPKKVDGDLFLTDEQKIDCQHEVQHTVLEELADANLEFLHLSFYLTSIYDHTVCLATTLGIKS